MLLQVLLEGAHHRRAGRGVRRACSPAPPRLFNRLFQWRYDTSLVFVRITPAIAWRRVALALPLGMAASVLASWALVRSDALKLVRR